ncbi:hypothetical protein [Luteolibacter sp. LG18]|uniref:hypothetical protein n=1 Tax=Luteolibacter sp. LG18 TaxID=2819286 RepID=UPI002B2C8A6A|nr:hypothetical protein llg_07400 [Luteolibacter sp. LG18]BCU79631.1 hypothetical protein llg_43460 [Luteolibacter sp. LG18]
MKTDKTTGRAPAKKAAKKAPKRQGNLKPQTRQKIAITARQAFDLQKHVGNIEDGVTFEQWRHAEVMAAVKRPGISACDGLHFRDLMVHFLVLAGREEEALPYGLKTGKVRDHGDVQDTHEEREKWLAIIATDLRLHAELAAEPVEPQSPAYAASWHSIKANGGPIQEGYVVFVAAQKFGIQKCRFERLKELLTAPQLEQLHHTIRNRITAREGKGSPENRNKSQRRKPVQPADPGDLAPRDVPF